MRMRGSTASGVLAWVVVLGQLLLVLVVFSEFFFQPRAYMLQDSWDGLKNYFTTQYYVHHDTDQPVFRFTGMNYPYGDYLFYTDNTPLLALLLRGIFKLFPLHPEWILPAFNWVILLSIPLASLFFFKLGSALGMRPGLAVLFAWSLPWLSPQLIRVFNHFNLSISLVYAVWLWLLYLWYRAVRAPHRGSAYRCMLLLGGWIALSSFLHLYYLPLLALPSAVLVAVVAISGLRRSDWSPLWSGLAGLGLAAGLVYGTVRLTDGYYAQRPDQAQTNRNWEARLGDVLTGYNFSDLLPPPWVHDSWAYERFLYLGAGCIYGGALLFLLLGAFRLFRRHIPYPSRVFLCRRSFVWGLVACGLLSLFVSLGNRVVLFGGSVAFDNIFSPLYYLNKLAPGISHFRALARFAWVFFYAANLLFFFYWERSLQLLARPAVRMGLSLVLLILVLGDSLAHLDYYRRDKRKANLFRERALDQLPELDWDAYQAIIPLPFFHKGNERSGYILDDDPPTSARAFQLAVKSGLPLVACKLDRTVFEHTLAAYSLFFPNDLHPDLLKDERPYLVVYREDYPAVPAGDAPIFEVLRAGRQLPQQAGMELLAGQGGFLYYRWKLTGGAESSGPRR